MSQCLRTDLQSQTPWQNLFGLTASMRGTAISQGLQDLLGQHPSKKDLKDVVIRRLERSSGIVDSIRTSNFEFLEATPLTQSI